MAKLTKEKTDVEEYEGSLYVKRWIEVDDLDSEIDESLPRGSHRKWSEVVSEGTLKIDGKWYPEVAHALCGEPRGLTKEQFKDVKIDLMVADDVNALKHDEMET